MTVVVVYDSNNSGGSWWLSDEDWKNLERHGWTVHWGGDRTRSYSDDVEEILRPSFDKDDRWLGGLAMTCAKRFDNADEGVNEWANITGQNPSDIGCTCCGPPHSFRVIDEVTGKEKYSSASIAETRMEWW